LQTFSNVFSFIHTLIIYNDAIKSTHCFHKNFVVINSCSMSCSSSSLKANIQINLSDYIEVLVQCHRLNLTTMNFKQILWGAVLIFLIMICVGALAKKPNTKSKFSRKKLSGRGGPKTVRVVPIGELCTLHETIFTESDEIRNPELDTIKLVCAKGSTCLMVREAFYKRKVLWCRLCPTSAFFVIYYIH